MSNKTPVVTCIGLANVDVIATVEDDFLARHNIVRITSNMLDACSTGSLLGQLQKPVFYPGGCAANTACGLAGFGVPARFVGRTGDDTYGDIFRQGFQPYGVEFETKPFPHKMTSTCLILVTPDKDRTFAFCTDTAAWHIAPSDLPDLPQGPSQYVCLESNIARMAVDGENNLMLIALEKYKSNGNTIIVNLNDRIIVNAVRPTLKRLLSEDVLFFIGNIVELQALFETDDADDALAQAAATGRGFAVTDGPDGAYIIDSANDEIIHVPAVPVADSFMVNTIGAGDQFSAGFIAGLIEGVSLAEAGRYGVAAAAQIIQQISPRPQIPRSKIKASAL